VFTLRMLSKGISFDRWYLGIFLIPLIVFPWGYHFYAAGKFLWALLFLGLAFLWGSFCVLRKQKICFYTHKKLFLYVLCLIVSLILSTIFSQAPLQSLWGIYLENSGLLFFLFLLIHFFICLHIFQNPKTIQRFFSWIQVLAIPICLHAIFQRWNLDPLVDVDNREHLFRIYGTLGQPNFLGQFLIFPIFITFFRWKEMPTSWRQGILFMLLLTTLLLTKNRASILGVGISLILYLSSLLTVEKRYKYGFFSGVILLWMVGFWARWPELRSMHSRLLIWEQIPQMLEASTLFLGNGLETFYRSFVAVMPREVFEYEKFYTYPLNAHNEVLHTLVERGLLGLSLYLVPIIFLVKIIGSRQLYKNLTIQITGLALFSSLISLQLSFSKVEHWIFIAAFWAILLSQICVFKSIITSFSRLSRGILAGVFIFFGSVCLFFFGSIFSGERALHAGVESYVFEKEMAYESFQKASRMLPVFASPKKIILDLFFIERTPDVFLSFQKEQLGIITQQDFEYEILNFQMAALQGDRVARDTSVSRAQLKAPNLPKLYTRMGDVFLGAGDCDQALSAYDHLYSLAPPVAFDAGTEEHRIFHKHAGGFVPAMERKEICEALSF